MVVNEPAVQTIRFVNQCGSSGGSAAALAAGLTGLEMGSDIGGSIRNPAHFCGVFGHKSSWNLIPQRGHSPPMTDGGGVPLAVLGPLARTAGDLQLGLDVLAGPEDLEGVGYALALPAPRHDRLWPVSSVSSAPVIECSTKFVRSAAAS